MLFAGAALFIIFIFTSMHCALLQMADKNSPNKKSNVGSFRCLMCGQGFVNNVMLVEHRKTHEGAEPGFEDLAADSVMPGQRHQKAQEMYQCDKCKIYMLSEDAIEDHKKTKHPA